MRQVFTALLAAILLCACGEDGVDIVSPDPPSIDVPVTSTPPDPVYPRVDQQFDWSLTRGFTLFAGARASEREVREIFDAYRAHWPGLTFTARVCAEVQSWPRNVVYLPQGAAARPNFDRTSAAYNELKHFLGVAATIPGAQVLVVGICTLKEDGTSWKHMKKWTGHICGLASQYENTAVEVVNEAHHPNSYFRGNADRVDILMRTCRDATSRHMEVGSDANITEHRRAYSYDRGLATFLSYHPWRNPDPTSDDLRGIVRQRIGGTVFSETTSLDVENYSPDYGGKTTDVSQIMDYARNAEEAGGVFFFHTTWGLGWPELPIGYIIDRGDWDINHGR